MNDYSITNVTGEILDKVKYFQNPFLNFLKTFRKRHKRRLADEEITRRATKLWRMMNDREKSPYVNMARKAAKPRKRSKTRRRVIKKYVRRGRSSKSLKRPKSSYRGKSKTRQTRKLRPRKKRS